MKKICVRCGMEYPNHKMSCKIPVEEWRLPTAEEFLDNPKYYQDHNSYNTQLAMTEFAKLHLEAQLKAILKNVTVDGDVPRPWINEDSIKNAYNLDNVK